MKITILQGRAELQPESPVDVSALEAMASQGVRLAGVGRSRKGKTPKLDYVAIEFSAGPDSPWRRISEDPPPEGEKVLLMHVSTELLWMKSRPGEGTPEEALEGAAYCPEVSWNVYTPHSTLPSSNPTHWMPCPGPFPEFRGAQPKLDGWF